jgi:hypothetical protein
LDSISLSLAHHNLGLLDAKTVLSVIIWASTKGFIQPILFLLGLYGPFSLKLFSMKLI